MAKKLLMLGGGFLQNFVIRKARDLGYYVYCLDANPNAEGFQAANESAVINIVDEEACLAFAREKKVDGVLTAATDYSVLSMSRIATELGLPGINYDSARLIKNKALVRKALFDAKADDTGYSHIIDSIECAQQIKDKIVYPVMVKPCDGSGSRGAARVDSADEFVKACEVAIGCSISRKAVAEPFVHGREYGVESFVNNGKIHILAVMQKDMTLPPYYAELGHAIPSGLGEELEQKVKKSVHQALVAMGVNHGSVNMDLLINDRGDVHIIDVGARMGGNLIGSHIIPLGTGVDYMGNMIKAAVGDPVDFNPTTDGVQVATRLLALTPGLVEDLPNFDDIRETYKVTIEHHLLVGDTINEYHTNLDGCGYVVATGNAAKALAEEVKVLIDNLIVRR